MGEAFFADSTPGFVVTLEQGLTPPIMPPAVPPGTPQLPPPNIALPPKPNGIQLPFGQYQYGGYTITVTVDPQGLGPVVQISGSFPNGQGGYVNANLTINASGQVVLSSNGIISWRYVIVPRLR